MFGYVIFCGMICMLLFGLWLIVLFVDNSFVTLCFKICILVVVS